MNPSFIPIIGDVINGAVEIFTDKRAAKENLTAKTTLASYPVILLGVEGMLSAQTNVERLTYGVVLFVGVAAFLYRKRGAA